ncbi:hypothetical protein DM02DRAFT_627818 [Periconia macrospinosa]|uniref:Uncharacterized protein n=1 Tax=Periconia macrospinosa TaxID=97972 RepID=A0A2V1DVL5_9PLEO|nr:hypothetical protein DM02DRAFT_627818 [Periconia macrospinosa]
MSDQSPRQLTSGFDTADAGSHVLLLEKAADISHTGQATIERKLHTATIGPHLSVVLGHEGVIRMLQKAESVEVRTEAELTGLHLAAILDDVAVINRYLEHNADPDMRCQANLVVGRRDNNLTANVNVVARALIDHGADVGAKTRDGRTTLQRADGPGGESTVLAIRHNGMEKSIETIAKERKNEFLKKLHKFFHAKSKGDR